MIKTFQSEADLAAAITELIKIETRFASVVEIVGTPSLRKAPVSFVALLHIITEQFLSLAAADAIWRRVLKAYHPITPLKIKRANSEKLSALGLSNAKIKSFKGVAEACLAGKMNFESLHAKSDADVLKMLIQLPGVGPWTAEIFLLSNLSRADAFPAGDLALQVAVQHLLGLSERPSAKALIEIALPWSPYRAAAARLLWAHYRLLKQMPQAA